jgi:hypothetical protein
MGKSHRVLPAALIAVFGCCFFFLVDRLPFYWEDMVWIGHSQPTRDALWQLLNPTFGTINPPFDRPVEVLVLRAIRNGFGPWPPAFYAFKGAVLALVGIASYVIVYLSTRAPHLAAGGMLLTLFYAGTLANVLWICDFLIVSMLLSLLAAALFYAFVRGHCTRWYVPASIVLLFVAAYRTKVYALVLPPAFLLYLAIERPVSSTRARVAAAMSVLMLAYAALNLWSGPEVLPPATIRAVELPALLRHLLRGFTPLILLHLVYLVWRYLMTPLADPLIRYLFIMTMVGGTFTLFAPAVDTRYLSPVFVPVALLYPVLVHFLSSRRLIGTVFHTRLTAALVLLCVAANSATALGIRRDLAMHIAKDNAVLWFERHVEGKTVAYVFWREYFNVPVSDSRNRYVLLGYRRGAREEFQRRAVEVAAGGKADFVCMSVPLPNRKPFAVFPGINGSAFDRLAPAFKIVGRSIPALYVFGPLTSGDFEDVYDAVTGGASPRRPGPS